MPEELSLVDDDCKTKWVHHGKWAIQKGFPQRKSELVLKQSMGRVTLDRGSLVVWILLTAFLLLPTQ